MTRVFRFQGSSDDTFGDVSPRGDDYDNCASGKPIVWLVKAGADRLLVWGQYAPNEAPCAGWVIGIANALDDRDELPIPAWPMRFEQGDAPYSPTLVIEAPDGAEMELVYPGAGC